MFDFDAGKLLIVGVIALIFIPPKDLPRVLRQVGQFVGKMRRMATEFQGQFMDAMREADMADLRREAQKLADSARVDVGFDAVKDLKTHLTGAIEGEPLLPQGDGSESLQGQGQGLKDPNPELRRLTGAGEQPSLNPSPTAAPDKARGEAPQSA